LANVSVAAMVKSDLSVDAEVALLSKVFPHRVKGKGILDVQPGGEMLSRLRAVGLDVSSTDAEYHGEQTIIDFNQVDTITHQHMIVDMSFSHFQSGSDKCTVFSEAVDIEKHGNKWIVRELPQNQPPAEALIAVCKFLAKGDEKLPIILSQSIPIEVYDALKRCKYPVNRPSKKLLVTSPSLAKSGYLRIEAIGPSYWRTALTADIDFESYYWPPGNDTSYSRYGTVRISLRKGKWIVSAPSKYFWGGE
jgi:hypothetical protein